MSKEKRFKVGATLTVRDKAECNSKEGIKGKYWFGGGAIKSSKITISYYGSYVEAANCYHISIKPSGYTMLESEFEEYSQSNNDDNYDVY